MAWKRQRQNGPGHWAITTVIIDTRGLMVHRIAAILMPMTLKSTCTKRCVEEPVRRSITRRLGPFTIVIRVFHATVNPADEPARQARGRDPG